MQHCIRILNEYLEIRGISISKMSKDTGIHYNTCRRIRKGLNKPSLEHFLIIIRTYKFINVDYVASFLNK